MKTIKILLLLQFVLTVSASGQADNIVGYWLTDEDKSQVQIFKASNGKYYGKIVWIKEVKDRNNKDDKNSDPKLKERKIMGLQILNNCVYDAKKKEWSKGTVYDPDNGKTYTCFLWFENNPNILKLKGYVLGLRFMGRETTWKREKTLRE
jgi:uncharacterized protein (DUF2147 family)